jgi:hypothetical protein
MADQPPKAGAKVSPKKETVRISLPPKPSAKETVRLTLPPKAGKGPVAPPAAPGAAPAAAAKQTVRLQLPPKPTGGAAAPAAPAAGAAKQTVRLQMPPKSAGGAPGAKQTVRLNLPPKPSGAARAAAPGKQELKALVPQTDQGAPGSAEIPDSEEEMPTMDSAAPPAKPGPRGRPPGSPPAAASTDSTPSAVSLPAKKAPKPKMAKVKQASAPSGGGSSVSWVDIVLGILATGTAIGAAVVIVMLKDILP